MRANRWEMMAAHSRLRAQWQRWVGLCMWLALFGLAQRAQAQSADQLALSYSAAPDPVLPGGKLVYTIRVANLSATTPTGAFVMRANFAEHLTASYAVDGSSCVSTCRYGGYTQFNVASLAPGASTVYRYMADVDNSAANPPPPAGTVLSSELVVINGSNATIKTATASVVVASAEPAARLALSMEENRAAPGATLTYQLHVGNAGEAALGLRLRAALPAGASFVGASGGGSANAGYVEWDLGSTPAAYTDRRELTVRVADTTPSGTLLPLRAELLDAGGASQVRAQVTGLVASSTPLSLTVQAVPSVALSGQIVVYKLHVANRSLSVPTPAFVMRAQLPAHAETTYNVDGSSCVHTCRYGGYLQWNVATLAPGEGVVYQFMTRLDNTAGAPPPPRGALARVEVTAFVHGGVEASDVLAVSDGSQLRLSSSLERNRPLAGSEATYQLTFGNAGNGAKLAKLRARIPASMSFVSASGGGSHGDGWVEWDLGSLAPGAVDRRELTVRVADGVAPGSLLNVRTELVEPSGRSIRRSAMAAQVSTEPMLSMVLSATPTAVQGDSVIVYRTRLANRSPSTPTGPFVVRAHFPEQATVTYVVDGSSCVHGCRFGGYAQWNLASLEPGSSTEITYIARVDNTAQLPPPARGELLSADVHAYVWGGYRASDVIAVSDGGSFDLTTSTAQDRAAPGADVTLKLSFGNSGAQSRPARLRVRLPEGTSLVAATGASESNGLVYWDLDMKAGAYDDRTLTLKLSNTLTSGTLLNLQPELVSLEDGHRYVGNRYPVLVAAQSFIGLTLEPSRQTVMGGDTVIYKLTVTNHSPSAPSGNFTVRVSFSEHATTTLIPDGSNCVNGCNAGGWAAYTVTSLAPGASRMLQFTSQIDNSAQRPPPAAGSVLEVRARAMVFGEALATTAVYVGTKGIAAYVPPIGGDAGTGSQDAGTDDAGSGADAGASADAGADSDAASTTDASADGDGDDDASEGDGGSSTTVDGGRGRDGEDDDDDEEPDASSDTDAGAGGGCSCRVAHRKLDGAPLSLLSALALLWRRRRVQRSAQARAHVD